MASWQAHFVSFVLRHTFKRRLARAKDALKARAILNLNWFKTPADVRIAQETLGGIPGEWVEGESRPSAAVLLYLHGGGYFACSARTHRAFTTAFARQGFKVFAPNYRLAPENPFPAAVMDAVAAYRAVRAETGASTPMVIAGDSAGGGLALATLLKLRDEGDALPVAAALFSPLTDLAGRGKSRETNDKRCAMFHAKGLARGAGFYLCGADPRDPMASPLYADLRGLPPMLIHVGKDETLLDDSTELAERARADGVPVELKVWDAVPHVWQLFHYFVPEGGQSLAEAAAFLKTMAAPANGSGGLPTNVDVLIVGSGFAGLCMAIQLRRAGMDSFLILERAADIGGTWRDNTYPGCACDIPSHLYSFSFECHADWTRMYPTQPEIWNYLKHCVEKYNLGPSIRFGSEVREAVFDEGAHLWRVETLDGATFTARSVALAMGPLSRPAYPRIPGLERFQGRAFHSAEWDHSCDLRGKRVAVIGTGASAIQFIPQIAPEVDQLHVFQRTPPWITPKMDRPIRRWERSLFRCAPGYMWLFRKLLYWRQEVLAVGFTGNLKFMKRIEQFARKHITKSIPDAALREKVTPDHLIGCKRILISNDYYPALGRANVELVTESITEVREHSIVTVDGKERAVDALIYGTGFRATDLLTPVRILGRNGIDLNDAWRDGFEAYFGITITGYPNLFMLVGPNTGLGHNSIVFMIEAQVNYVMSCLELLRKKGAAAMDLRPEVQAEFNRGLQERMKRTVWASGCKSWYLDANGKNTTLWPGFSFKYWMETRKVAGRDYAFWAE
ncbi:MAG: alpha/beta hydrolase fold domain-containing protein [Acidobacteriia bacterium]|nr:alpha/beta hydrolase fold domain-containing protein [Terriglobia bacterium]